MRYQLLGLITLILATGCARHSEYVQNNSVSSAALTEEQRDALFVTKIGGRNLTAEFTQRLRASSDVAATQSAKNLEGCDVLFVHGWLGEVALHLTTFLDRISCNQRILDYLKDQRYAADELGLCSAAPAYRSESVCACGEKVARLIAENPRPVIIVSHSKGCLDSLEALLLLQRSGQLNKVAGWIAMQGPFYGSENAAKFIANAGPMAKLRLKLFGARIVGVHDMCPECRMGYMETHRAEIESLIHSVPLICFASWKTPTSDNQPLADGPVAPESAILPGADYIAKGGIAHSMAVIGVKNTPFDRIAFTKVMLEMLGDRLHAPTPKP